MEEGSTFARSPDSSDARIVVAQAQPEGRARRGSTARIPNTTQRARRASRPLEQAEAAKLA